MRHTKRLVRRLLITFHWVKSTATVRKGTTEWCYLVRVYRIYMYTYTYIYIMYCILYIQYVCEHLELLVMCLGNPHVIQFAFIISFVIRSYSLSLCPCFSLSLPVSFILYRTLSLCGILWLALTKAKWLHFGELTIVFDYLICQTFALI